MRFLGSTVGRAICAVGGPSILFDRVEAAAPSGKTAWRTSATEEAHDTAGCTDGAHDEGVAHVLLLLLLLLQLLGGAKGGPRELLLH